MTNALIAKLPKQKRQELLNDLNYLNLSEIKAFCKRHSIPYRIAIETDEGKRITTKEDDRKGVILARVRHFLSTGVVLEATCFPSRVVRFEPLAARFTENDRLFYGQYDKTNRAMTALLKTLTGGKFKNGAIARILAREFWSNGKAPRFGEYALAWTRASEKHRKPNPEWAFLSERARVGAVPNWKELRARKVSKVLKILNQLPSSRTSKRK